MHKRLLLVYSADGMANSLRAQKLKQAFSQVGLRVVLFDSKHFFEDFYEKRSQDTWWSWLKYKLRFLSPVVELLPCYKLAKRYPFIGKLVERASAIRWTKDFICSRYVLVQSPYEMLLLTKIFPWQTAIYDAHTCFVDELKPSSKNMSETELNYLAQLEEKIFKQVDILTFAWPAVRHYLVKKYHLDEKNVVRAPWGTDPRAAQAKWQSKPKVVYLGNTDDYWVDVPNLIKLAQDLGLQFDIYGHSQNQDIRKLPNYQGYLSDHDLEQVANYQFGLISLSQDTLRKQTFSAKHLFYFSFGLPVLCPVWRQDSLLAAGTIYYRPEDLVRVVAQYSQRELWLEKSQAARKIAQKYRWQKQLQSLVNRV